MRAFLLVVSGAALVVTIGAPILYLTNVLALGQMKLWMALSAVAWFVATPFWMERRRGA